MTAKLTSTKKVCMIILILYLIIAMASNFIMPYETDDFSHDALLRPSKSHLLGTDEMGRDIFSMLINGFKSTIFISLMSGLLSTLIGIILAFMSCLYKGKIDGVIFHLSNLFLIVPEIIIIMFFAVFSKPDMLNTILSIVFFSWSKVYKIVRSKLMGYMEKNKVKYTMLIKGNVVDLFKKLYFDLYPVAVTCFILQCNKAVMYETTLSFFGIGDPLSKTWGKLIKAAINYENLFYDDAILWYLIPAILCVFVYVLSLSLLTFEE
ncbi:MULTISPECIES: ABC transporter permease [unclassified Sedimentibacter]|uniref:ABC transporter permease n=1 Tax=unclassified Sedimentibacter TaxID=2649220 RepID=UPI0027E1D6EB|nr:ABC transporter permease [Sedimentibacter sp. MB35-C1]WMJ78740.1 ABC transporter permease [Sedimentibacter sp. MB35-C1]